MAEADVYFIATHTDQNHGKEKYMLNSAEALKASAWKCTVLFLVQITCQSKSHVEA